MELLHNLIFLLNTFHYTQNAVHLHLPFLKSQHCSCILHAFLCEMHSLYVCVGVGFVSHVWDS